MSVSTDEILRARALRDDARAIFAAHVSDIRADLSAESIGQRIKSRAVVEAANAIETTQAIAAENKVVVGATVTGLIAWLSRGPIFALARRLNDRWKLERLWPW